MAEQPSPAQEPAGDITPSMAQYLAIRDAHPGYLLFYRMGDFYELFFADAVQAAAALDISLTKRGKHLGDDIPMFGVPVHAAESYMEKLIRRGFRVAVCEQLEDPAEARRRGGKAVVKRDVVRLVTPGTLTEDALLEARSSNILAALGFAGGKEAPDFALAAADLSTGSFSVAPVEAKELASELARVSPREILFSEGLSAHEAVGPMLKACGAALSPLPQSRFDSLHGERALCGHYGVAALDGFGNFSRAELSGAGALVAYLELTQKGRHARLARLLKLAPSRFMAIDAATRRNLELTATLSGARTGSLLEGMDMTVTAAGARELAARLAAPLTDVRAIAARLDSVQCFAQASELRRHLRQALRSAPDLSRSLARLALARGGPRDLANLRDAIKAARALRDGLSGARLQGEAADAAAALGDALAKVSSLSHRLELLLVEEPAHFTRDGGFIKSGAHAPLDELRTLAHQSRRVVASLENRYRAEAGVPQLKIKHNGILGYFIEVTQQHADKLLGKGDMFRHRQTMAGAARFSTEELANLASRIGESAQASLALERALFDEVVGLALDHQELLGRIADALALFDVSVALGELAVTARYVRPTLDDSLNFKIVRGRHPVVERALQVQTAMGFVANDCDLSPAAKGRLWLVTGPNMAGKSTFLRQNAVIAILAQMGSFVPADAAHIGIVDRLFSRVGAGDDLAAGRSTFMVEMVETAAILNQATSRSLVILDEIGRGTATYDGLAIAWAAAEHLHETNKCRALFATHYHEMVALAERLSAMAAVTMKVKEWNDNIVFLHEVTPGAADRSYGIHVAKLAGLPDAVIARAEAVLRALEEGREGHQPLARIDDLPLFGARASKPRASAIEAALKAIEPDSLSPKEALAILYDLKRKLT
ncbi:MAG: DNA mismatch repair protein MutS [Rhizomicrobium sp.]